MLAIADAIRIKLLCKGKDKVAIKSAFEVAVFNFETNSKDFKIRLWKEDVSSELTCSFGWMAISRAKDTLLLHFDDEDLDAV